MKRQQALYVPAAVAAFLGIGVISVPTALGQEDAAGGPAILRSQLRNSVSLPGGTVIHQTSSAIANLRTVAVPGSSTAIVLWEEPGAGGTTHYYAFTRDGRTLLGRVMETSYTIRLRYSEFDPMRGVPAVDKGLLAAGASDLFMVQMVATPLPEMQAAVEAAGGTILRFMQDHTCVVRMAPGARAGVSALPFVRWVGPVHVAYKLDESILAEFRAGGDNTAARYSIECFERGAAAQQAVANKVAALGGLVEVMTPDQFRMEATLTPSQLLQIADMDEVYFVDPWGGPGGLDMNLVRQIGGGNYIESTLGFTGQGVRAEVFDSELRNTHQEFTTITPVSHSGGFGNPANPHGSSTYGIMFARGASANARGMLPNAAEGYYYDYTASTQFGGAVTRLSANQQLVNPALTFQCVLQTSSIGSTQITTYSTISAEVDDYLYQTGLLSTQSQSNTSNNNSRPQAWAKNIVSVGAVNHFNTLSRADDQWPSTAASCGSGGSASIGPAADGRIKPDLCFFYDCTFTTDNTSNTSYTEFGGTSGATPSTGGYFGLFFQMWHQGVWAGHGGASSVFASRSSMMAAKAALVNSAFRYTWTAGGPNASIVRNVQGWGMPDLQKLYDLRNKTFIVDETDVLLPLASKSYQIRVVAGEPELNVTMAYKDRMGPTSSTQHRINDLSLKVTSPTGTVYWGNNGLTAGNFSTSGGVANTKDTVENVFIQSPAAGVWTVTVSGDQIIQDTHPATPAIDADYGLWLTGGVQDLGPTARGPYAYTIQSNGNDHLYRIDLASGEATDLGLMNFGDAEGMSFGPDGDLFAIGGTTAEFWNVSRAPGVLVGATGPRNGGDAGLDSYNGVMYNLNGGIGASSLYRINTSTGAATLLGSNTIFADNLAIDGLGQAFAVDSITTDSLYSINLTNGAATLIGPLNVGNIIVQFGLSFSADNTLWAIASDGKYYTINTSTGAATQRGQVTIGGTNASGFEGFAIDRTSAFTKMDLPAFGSTFSSATATRGFYFTAPYNGSIGGLRVPDEFGAGVQNVEVVRFNAGVPPVFPANTNDFVSLGRFVNVAGSNIISCDIPVGVGEVIGVLGATGTTTLRNSYATPGGVINATMKGQPTTLTRLVMQANLNTTPASNLSAEISATAPISRVELYYQDGRQNLYLDADAPVTGSNLVTTPLVSPLGTTTFIGELTVGVDPEMTAAGAQGNNFDIAGAQPNATAEFNFNFDVDAVTFIYGGNAGEIRVEARNAANAIVDTFYQADTGAGQPAGPQILAGTGIRKLRWLDTTGSFAPLDNVRIHGTPGGPAPCYANCDNSTIPPILNVSDFICFQTKYAAGDPYANCDNSTIPPVLNVSDFICYQTKYAAGCP